MNAQVFADIVNSGRAPWLVTSGGKENDWSDSTKEQYFNILMADIANEQELNMWRLNNEYNTPENQMKRLIQAGINPAAAYQNISSGNSTSAPNVHKADTAKFRDTTDKLAKINTIMSGISNIMSTIKDGVGAVQGIQDIHFGYQNNWIDQMRRDVALKGFVPLGTSDDVLKGAPGTTPIRVGNNLYMSSRDAFLFPEFLQALKLSKSWSDYDISYGARLDDHSIAQRRTRIDGLIQDIFSGFEQKLSFSELLPKFLELFVYSIVQKGLGGF